MHKLITQNIQAISSLDLVKIINEAREEGKAELRHNDFTAKIRKVLGDKAAIFIAPLKTDSGQNAHGYLLPKREAHLMVMSESYKVQAAVYDRLQELESKQAFALPNFNNPAEAARAFADEFEAKQKALAEVAKLNTIIDNEFGYCSILRAAVYAGVHESLFDWRVLKRFTLGIKMEVKRVPSPRYGYQNLYPIKAFQECYSHIDFDDLTPELVQDKSQLAIVK
jgi:hypothetical protein